jgi:multiple sugar transport system permease protein
MTRKNLATILLRGVVIGVLLLWSVGPVLAGLATSLSTQTEINEQPAPLWPARPDFGNYAALLNPNFSVPGSVSGASEVKAFGTSLRNTLVSTTVTVVAVLVVCILAGYAFNRLRFPGRRVLFYGVIATLTVPAFALLAPLFRLLSDLKLMDTFPGLALIYLSALGPLAVWLFYNYTGDLPLEPEEAALVDGCNRWQSFVFVVLPQMVPGIAAITAIEVLSVWGQFLLPLLFAPTLATKPVTVLITEFVGKYSTNVPLISAAGMLALIPPALVALFLNRHIRGILSGWDK